MPNANMETQPPLPIDKILSLDAGDRIEFFKTLSFNELEAVSTSLSMRCDKQRQTIAEMTAAPEQAQTKDIFSRLFNRN